MTTRDLIFRGLRHHARANLAILAGMAVGTAVLTGALLVGDSIRGSLRDMTLERLGDTDFIMLSQSFFHEELAAEIAEGWSDCRSAPAILLSGTVRAADSDLTARGISIIGCDDQFAELDPSGVLVLPEDWNDGTGRKVLLNERLATEVGAKKGDAVLLRFDVPSAVPAEGVFGRKRGRIDSIRIEVAGVIPDRGFGRFGLLSGQHTPLNVYVPLSFLQEKLGHERQVNVSLFSVPTYRTEERADGVRPWIRGTTHTISVYAGLEDTPLRAMLVANGAQLALESERLLIDQAAADAIQRAAREVSAPLRPALTYLANSIESGDKSVPYSTVTAMDVSASDVFGNFVLLDGSLAPSLAPNEILLNDWAADDLAARIGDEIRLAYYKDGPGGALIEETSEPFVVRGIVRLEGAAADPGLTPHYPGIQDATRISDWDPPFEIDTSRIRKKDEEYWERHKATPKAFISLETGRKMWGSRFGDLTSVRIGPADGKTLSETEKALRYALVREIVSSDASPFDLRAVKADGLAASKGATDFSGLFIGFSFFIIISAISLVRLFFLLGVERRSREIGILLATGYAPSDVRRLFMAEGAVLAAAGGVIGAALGIGYAALMLHGLRTWWSAAVGTTHLFLHITPVALIGGIVGGAATGLFSVWLAVRSLSRAEPSRLLAGGRGADNEFGEDPAAESRKSRRGLAIAAALALIAVACAAGSGRAEASVRAGLFYTAGMSALAAALVFLSARMRAAAVGGQSAAAGSAAAAAAFRGFAPLVRLAMRNAARRRGRSVLTIGLVASAVFVIIAVAANRHGEGSGVIEKNSGNGGYALMAESDAPVLFDMNTDDGRFELNIPDDAAALLDDSQVHAARLRPGEDVSCLNLFRPTRPRVLGVKPGFIERGGFAFASSLAETDAEKANPWLLLSKPLPAPETPNADVPRVPVIGDLNTVMWILHSGLGKAYRIQDSQGGDVDLVFVALLSHSALQGELVVAESDFIDLFPGEAGSRFFFIETPESAAPELQRSLESAMSDFGFDVFSTRERIDNFFAVQNTYLSTFQALGGLGLMLGTLGLAVVMLRNVIDRRGELALLRAVGFAPGEVARLIFAENAMLLAAGMVIGTGSALLAVAPNWMTAPGAVEWISLAGTLAWITAFGLAGGAVAVAGALRAPILPALRGD